MTFSVDGGRNQIEVFKQLQLRIFAKGSHKPRAVPEDPKLNLE
jgi:hypothetical protein